MRGVRIGCAVLLFTIAAGVMLLGLATSSDPETRPDGAARGILFFAFFITLVIGLIVIGWRLIVWRRAH
jgi:hypothetical protein